MPVQALLWSSMKYSKKDFEKKTTEKLIENFEKSSKTLISSHTGSVLYTAAQSRICLLGMGIGQAGKRGSLAGDSRE